MRPIVSACLGCLRRLAHETTGNVLFMTAIGVLTLAFAMGFVTDYSRAQTAQTELNAIADAAALAAIDPAMILQTDDISKTAATNMFNAQSATIAGVSNIQLNVSITDQVSGTLGNLRTVTVSYTANSNNIFASLLNAATLAISGSSTANSSQPPNINFYLLLDNSPSMLLPSTSSGLTAVSNATKAHVNSPYGCDFACHEQTPHNDGIYINDTSGRQVLLSSGYYGTGTGQGVYYLYNTSTKALYTSAGAAMNAGNTTFSITDSSNGPVTINKTVGGVTTTYDTGYWADGYWLTHNYGLIYGSPSALSLRQDDEISAATQLVPFAASQAASYSVTYQLQLFSFDWIHPNASSSVTVLNSMTNVNNYSSSFSAASLMPATDYWFANSQYTSSYNNNDQATDFTNTLKYMNTYIGTPGTGASNSTPQAVLFIVTDGMADEPSSSGRWHAPFSSTDLAQCSAMKNKGIKIAILYTQYLPQALTGDSWSQTNIAPYLTPNDQVLTALQQCASTGANGSALVQTVTTNGDFTAALQQLFVVATQSARLVQ